MFPLGLVADPKDSQADLNRFKGEFSQAYVCMWHEARAQPEAFEVTQTGGCSPPCSQARNEPILLGRTKVGAPVRWALCAGGRSRLERPGDPRQAVLFGDASGGEALVDRIVETRRMGLRMVAGRTSQ